jgi:hypothetical protein
LVCDLLAEDIDTGDWEVGFRLSKIKFEVVR